MSPPECRCVTVSDVIYALDIYFKNKYDCCTKLADGRDSIACTDIPASDAAVEGASSRLISVLISVVNSTSGEPVDKEAP